LGSQLARRLVDTGAALSLTDTSLVEADLRDPAGAGVAVAATVRAHGRLDGVVFAEGVVAFGPGVEVSDEVLRELFGITVFAPIRLLRAATPALTASDHGHPGTGHQAAAHGHRVGLASDSRHRAQAADRPRPGRGRRTHRRRGDRR